MFNSNSKNFDQAVMLDIMSKLSNINDIFPLAENSHLITKNHSPTDIMKVDVLETKKGYLIKIDIPGVSKEDINIKLHHDNLKITAKWVDTVRPESFVRKERFVGEFSRNLSLPLNIDKDNISSMYVNGELVIDVPKLKDSIPAKSIEIK